MKLSVFLSLRFTITFIIVLLTVKESNAISINITGPITIQNIPYSTPFKDAMFNNNKYYLITPTYMYYFDYTKLINIGIMVSDGNVYGAYVKLSSFDGGTSYTCIAAGDFGVYFATNNQFSVSPNIPYSVTGGPKLITGGGPNNLVIAMDYPYSLVQSYNNVIKKQSTTYSVPTTDLVCDFISDKCFVATELSHEVITIDPNKSPTTLSSKIFNTTGNRLNGIVNPYNKYIYYAINDVLLGIIIEAYTFSSDLVFRKELGKSYGSFISMTFDSNQGTLFIAATNYLISINHLGGNIQTVASLLSDVVSLDIYPGQSANDNDNYLIVTKSSALILVLKYDSNCPNNCNNAGYCTYGSCNCFKGGNATCLYEINYSTTEKMSENLTITLFGKFQDPSPTKDNISIYVGNNKIPTNYITSIGVENIVFWLDFYSSSRLITLTMNNQNSTFLATNLYPDLSFNSMIQSVSILNLIGGPFYHFYSMKAIITSENDLERSITIVDSSNVQFTMPTSSSSRFEFIVSRNDIAQENLIFDPIPIIQTIQPTLLYQKGSQVTVQGYYFGDSPIIWVNETLILDIEYLNNEIKFQMPPGVYQSFILGNGRKNITIELSYQDLSILSVIQTDVQKLTILFNNINLNQNDIQIKLSNQLLEINGFDIENGIINVTLTNESVKGELSINDNSENSFFINLRPNITSITPIYPSNTDDTITIYGLYLSTHVEYINSKNEISKLKCSTTSTNTSISCDFPRGIGLFSLRSISEHPTHGGESLISNIYQSKYLTNSSNTGGESQSSSDNPTTSPSLSEEPQPNIGVLLLQSKYILVLLILIVLIF